MASLTESAATSAAESAGLDGLTYEQAFDQLEETLARLETGDLPLEETLSLYERGAALAAFCSRKLDEAELRVRQWQPGDVTTPFDDWQER